MIYSFLEWAEIFESTITQKKLISGPGVELLRDKFKDMGARGAPNEWNNYGFNKQDYTNYLRLSQFLDQKELPEEVVIKMLEILSHYRNTQIKDYNQINDLVSKDLLKNKTVSHDLEKIHVFDKQKLEYGKIKVYIPKGISRSSLIAINKIIDKKLISNGETRSIDSFGKESLPRYKLFSKDRTSLHTYRIHSSVINEILEIIKSKEKIEVEFESGASSLSAQSSQQNNQQKEIVILGEEKTSYGNKLAIKFNMPYEKSRSIFDALKTARLTPVGISYTRAFGESPNRFLINIDNLDLFKKVKEEIAKFEVDTSDLEEFEKRINKSPEEDTIKSSTSSVSVLNFIEENDDKIKIKINYRAIDAVKKSFLRESIQYTFPNYRWNKEDYSYTLSGNYKQYVTFGRLLKKFGYDVKQLRSIIKSKLENGKLIKTDWEGQYDEDENFISSIDSNLPNSKFDLYDEQKRGIAFLYGRNHAILGDETGLGKTVQLISAAALKMQSIKKPTLIITLKSTQAQWVNEIINVMGDDVKSKISTDPSSPDEWTVVYYDNFSSGKKLSENLEKLSSADFGIAIFDELHKVKHSKSKRSQNIEKVTKEIPVKWGASATVSSNKPMDVRNQLKITGHPLGDVSDSKFKRDFAGMTPTGYGGAFEETSNEEEKIKAAERLNKWLNLSGVYVRRSKSDIRKMPNLEITSDSTNVDSSEFSKKYKEKLLRYKDPNLAISQLIAARESVAQLKTDKTTRKVSEIVRSKTSKGEMGKVVVFTNFIESGRKLVEKIEKELKNINPDFYVLTYLSDTSKSDRSQVKSRFTNDPNAKVLIMSMRMGGTGIDFPNAAQNMVINDFDWTPESAEQSEGRIYRINTNHPVKIEYVVSDGIDKDLYEIVQKKRKIATIIQKYRREYQNSEENEQALEKLVSAQKEMNKLDQDMLKVVNKIPTMEEKNESFKGFFDSSKNFHEVLFGEYFN